MELVHQKNSQKNILKETQKTRLDNKKKKYQESTLKEYEQKYNFKHNCSPLLTKWQSKELKLYKEW